LEKRWNILPYNETVVSSLQQVLKVSRPACTILSQRGIHNFDEARDYFRPQLNMLHSPWLMKDMHKAVNRISAAIEKGQKILVFGDYDVDGTTAVACYV